MMSAKLVSCQTYLRLVRVQDVQEWEVARCAREEAKVTEIVSANGMLWISQETGIAGRVDSRMTSAIID